MRNFRNQIHLQLMIALLMVVIVRLVLYVDLVATEYLGALRTTGAGFTINTKVRPFLSSCAGLGRRVGLGLGLQPVVCEAFYFALEYFKTVTFAWMFIEGFYLHNTVVVTVFSEEPKLWRYLVAGWGIPLTHTAIWLMAVVLLSGKVRPSPPLLSSYPSLHAPGGPLSGLLLPQPRVLDSGRVSTPPACG